MNPPPTTNVNYEYIAYIDEAGDPGLKKVKPLDANGSSEWLIIAATVVNAQRESEVVQWSKDFVNLSGSRQTKQIHFRKLNDKAQVATCLKFSELPLRAFVVCSNKKNMKNWKNPFADAMAVTLVGSLSRYQWFYYWVSRILLEKVTDWVFRHSMATLGRPGKLKIEFSERGGIRYDEIDQYYKLLKAHDRNGTQFIDFDTINWQVIERELIEAYPHNSRAGLVLPDIVASSFFAACDKHDRGKPPNPLSAFRLDPRMARRRLGPNELPAGYGVKLMPSVQEANLDEDQFRVFRHYGYRK